MIYRSNLEVPDLSSHFKLLVTPRHWSLGHSIPSDPDYEPDCCFMSHDEAAILYHCAQQLGGAWLDIGARMGWTAAHIAEACIRTHVMAVDQDYRVDGPYLRADSNLDKWRARVILNGAASADYLKAAQLEYQGFCIDGNHDDPEPLRDATAALTIAAETCCMVFHDFRGRPIRDAVRYLMAHGFRARVYWTPAMMAVCWRGDFVPPVHVRDPAINWMQVRRASEIDQDFDLKRCE